MKRFLTWFAEFFQEDNGGLSSMRLVVIFACLVVVPGFLIACLFFPEVRSLANGVLMWAGGLVGIKCGQKFGEKPYVAGPNPDTDSK